MAVTDDPVIAPGASGIQFNNIRDCARCGLRYDWRRSPSTLRMTYCSSLCERGDLGFTIEALIKNGKAPAATPPAV